MRGEGTQDQRARAERGRNDDRKALSAKRRASPIGRPYLRYVVPPGIDKLVPDSSFCTVGTNAITSAFPKPISRAAASPLAQVAVSALQLVAKSNLQQQHRTRTCSAVVSAEHAALCASVPPLRCSDRRGTSTGTANTLQLGAPYRSSGFSDALGGSSCRCETTAQAGCLGPCPEGTPGEAVW